MKKECDFIKKVDYFWDESCEYYYYNSILFLEYLKSEGLVLGNEKDILDITTDPSKSLSRLLKDYKTFLLSTKVNRKELEKYNIRGAFGYISRSGVRLPRCLINDELFLHDRSYVPRNGYPHNTINKYDYIVSNGIPEDNGLSYHNKDYFIGFCDQDYDGSSRRELDKLYKLRESLIQNTGENYVVMEDSCDGKVLGLLKRDRGNVR